MPAFQFKPPALDPAIIEQALKMVFALKGEERLQVPLTFKDAVQAVKKTGAGIDESGLAHTSSHNYGISKVQLKAAAVVHLVVVAYASSLCEYTEYQKTNGNYSNGAYSDFLRNAKAEGQQEAQEFYAENAQAIQHAADSWDNINRFSQRLAIAERIFPMLAKSMLGEDVDVRFKYDENCTDLAAASSKLDPVGKEYHQVTFGDRLIRQEDGMAGALGDIAHELTHVQQKVAKEAYRASNGETLEISSEVGRIKAVAVAQMMQREYSLLYVRNSEHTKLYESQPCEAEATMKGAGMWHELQRNINQGKAASKGQGIS